MTVDIEVTRLNARGYLTDVHITGLDPAERYDVLRRAYEYIGDDDEGNPRYELWLPDRRSRWSAVAHRIGWPPQGSGEMWFRDYEPDLTPFAYFCVKSSLVGPTEWDFDDGNYPLTRGTLDDQIVHLAYMLEHRDPKVVIRSTVELGKWVDPCVYDLPKVTYTARGTEFGVMHRQYPVYVADTREARRGQLVVVTQDQGEYNLLREIVFPSTGRIKPIIFDAVGGLGLLLYDNATVVPLDIDVELVSQRNAEKRFVTISFVEVDRTLPGDQRSGDNDDHTDPPNASFTVSDSTPATGEWITCTNTSTGQWDSVEWTWSYADGTVGHSRSLDPLKVRWFVKGQRFVRLRVYGAIDDPQGADVTTHDLTVH